MSARKKCANSGDINAIIRQTDIIKNSLRVSKRSRKRFIRNHGRGVALSYIQRLSEAVGSIVQAKEESETYKVPEMDCQITTVAVGLDGTCMLMCEAG